MKKAILSYVLAIAAFGVAVSVRAVSVSFPAKDVRAYDAVVCGAGPAATTSILCLGDSGCSRFATTFPILGILRRYDDNGMTVNRTLSARMNAQAILFRDKQPDSATGREVESDSGDGLFRREESTFNLKTLGFTPDDIEKFRSIMLE